MGDVTKIAPNRQGGQEKDLGRLEERMHFLLGEIAECNRIIRQAKEAENKMVGLRKELLELAFDYVMLEEGAR